MSALVSIRHIRHGSVLNQGQLGSCTGNAGTGAMMTSPFPMQKLTEKFAKQLYSDATQVDNIPGAYPPQDTGSSGLAVAKVLKTRGLISGYKHCFSPEAVYTALQDGPVMLGVSWMTGFDTPTADGQMVYKGTSRGGHELCADEIDVENKRIWVTNSWGKSWSVQGRAWWSFDDFAKIMADSGDAVVPQP
jgi:hypothetical protein